MNHFLEHSLASRYYLGPHFARVETQSSCIPKSETPKEQFRHRMSRYQEIENWHWSLSSLRGTDRDRFARKSYWQTQEKSRAHNLDFARLEVLGYSGSQP